MLKKCIRQIYLAKRQAYTSQYIEQNSKLINNKLFTHFNFDNIQFVHIYLPMLEKKEINTFLIINEMFANHKNVQLIVPVINFENKLLLHKYYHKDELLHQNKYGIMEPLNSPLFTKLNTLDLVIVPLLSFDKKGHRVGYGSGYYDRFLSHATNAKKIGLSFEEAIDSIIDVNHTDYALDFCITPNHVYAFTR